MIKVIEPIEVPIEDGELSVFVNAIEERPGQFYWIAKCAEDGLNFEQASQETFATSDLARAAGKLAMEELFR